MSPDICMSGQLIHCDCCADRQAAHFIEPNISHAGQVFDVDHESRPDVPLAHTHEEISATHH